ncbi:hypothetical protein MNV49_002165 [Pseudohyphozyma bogoriensis]|nr:hypothetical protein MNV49_002165 [Pseudohyphozyma bogoriensis]
MPPRKSDTTAEPPAAEHNPNLDPSLSALLPDPPAPPPTGDSGAPPAMGDPAIVDEEVREEGGEVPEAVKELEIEVEGSGEKEGGEPDEDAEGEEIEDEEEDEGDSDLELEADGDEEYDDGDAEEDENPCSNCTIRGLTCVWVIPPPVSDPSPVRENTTIIAQLRKEVKALATRLNLSPVDLEALTIQADQLVQAERGAVLASNVGPKKRGPQRRPPTKKPKLDPALIGVGVGVPSPVQSAVAGPSGLSGGAGMKRQKSGGNIAGGVAGSGMSGGAGGSGSPPARNADRYKRGFTTANWKPGWDKRQGQGNGNGGAGLDIDSEQLSWSEEEDHNALNLPPVPSDTSLPPPTSNATAQRYPPAAAPRNSFSTSGTRGPPSAHPHPGAPTLADLPQLGGLGFPTSSSRGGDPSPAPGSASSFSANYGIPVSQTTPAHSFGMQQVGGMGLPVQVPGLGMAMPFAGAGQPFQTGASTQVKPMMHQQQQQASQQPDIQVGEPSGDIEVGRG